MSSSQLREGCVVNGSLFNEPMRVETVSTGGWGTWTVGFVGTKSERFRRVILTESDIKTLTISDSAFSYGGDGRLLRLGLQAYSLGLAYEFDPCFGLSISRVDPLPHQLEAVYDYLLKLARVRFLLADDAGAEKTIMAGLLIRELQLRGLAERIMVVCPANLSFQWQRELKEKFDEKFLLLKGGDIRDQFGVNQWLEQNKVIRSLDLAKRTEILPGLRQVHWDLVIVDEAHRMSWTPPARKTARYALGELIRDTSDHLLLLTATPHKGDPGNFTLFLQLLDVDAYADVRSIREAMNRWRAPFYLRRTKEAMVYFPAYRPAPQDGAGRPERRPDGTWVAEKIFTKRIPHTVDFRMDGPEFDLYREITRFVKRQSARAAAQDDPRARAVGFLMSLYQRRLASSTYSMRRSLENRARRLEEGLKRAQELARIAPPDLPDPDELEEMEESERERLFAVEIRIHHRNKEDAEKAYKLVEPSILGDFIPSNPPEQIPNIVKEPEPVEWLHVHAMQPFIEETRQERLDEVERIAEHVELSLTELLQRADEEIGKASIEKEKGVPGADGRLAQAENRHAELLARRERRRSELERQRSLSLQAVERIASVLILPHPEREAPDVRRMRPSLETEAIAMRVVMEYEQAQGRRVHDVHEKNLGYDITSLDPASGELRLIEVKGLAAATGTILLTPNERRVAEDRRDCYWLYIVTRCRPAEASAQAGATKPTLQEPVKDPARFPWHEVSKVAHYWLEVNAMTKPMQVREDSPPYGVGKP